MPVTLRPYQQAGLDAVRATYAAGARRVCYTLPTGGGKTVMFAWLVARTAERGKSCCILVHRDELVGQVCAALRAEGVPHGVIKAGRDAGAGLPVQVASVFSLARRGTAQAFDLIVVDECHHVAAGSWAKVLEAQAGAYVLGVTATPCRLDGRGLAAHFEALVQGPTVPELIAGGHLSPVRVFAPSTVSTKGVHKRGGDYIKAELAALLDRPTVTGDAVAHYLRLCAGLPAVAFCVTVEHAEHVAADFRAAGVQACSIDGTMTPAERAHRLNDLRTGEVQVLASCELISEGFDLPCIAAALLLRPTASTGLYLQQVGRALRPAPGKAFALVLDHVGNVHKHGLPDQAREWVLEADRPKAPRAMALRTCGECYAVYPAVRPSCPVCGFEPVPDAGGRGAPEGVAGDLVEVTDKEQWRAMTYKAALRRCKTRADLEAMARARGYKSGWVFRMLAQRAGV